LRVLLVHKPRKRDAWQLPQGGIEPGETAREGVLRELQEEAGLQNVTLLGQSAEVYQYDFPTSYRRFRPDHVKGQRIEFFIGIAASEAFVVDGQEIDRAQWVHPRTLPRYLRRRAYLDLVRRVVCEAEGLLPPAVAA
jgi:putative (di)nucleoside polyphosphate hydrolase